MPINFNGWVFDLTQTVAGIIIFGLSAATLGGIASYYIVKRADAWAEVHSEKKRKQTIDQLKADVELLKPLRVDRDRLSILNFLFTFVVLGLIAAGPVLGAGLRYASVIPNALAIGLAFYWGRTLYRLNKFEEYEEQIEARIRKLSTPEQQDPINQPVTVAKLNFSDNLIKSNNLTVTSVSEPSRDWNITGGKWIPKENGLELVSVNPDGGAAYIWRTKPLNLPATIRFNATFIKSQWLGLRLNLFAESPHETYLTSNHLQLLIPWENGGYKMDYMNNGPVAITQKVQGLPVIVGKTYFYVIDVSLEKVTVRMDGQIQFSADIKNNLALRSHILRMPNAGWYWGFAAQGGLYEIRDISIVSGD